MPKVVVAGGSGFVGGALVSLLVQLKYDVVVLSRQGLASAGARGVAWDGVTVGAWSDKVDGADAIVNLTGSPISRKWTKEARNEILTSRVRSTEALGKAVLAATSKPKVWVNASAVGFYGDRGAEELNELSGPGRRGSFLVDTCVAWEATFDRCETCPETRKTKVRIGVVLGRTGGALPPLARLARYFLGGHLGSGAQYVSWIHIKDLARLLVHTIESDMGPVVNATAPAPVSNRFFMATLRGLLGRPWAPPVPAFALEVANWFGAPDPALVLESQRVLPNVAREAGFRFEYEDLRDAMQSLL